ncbi:MAG TPA: hypothetical protein PKA06_02930, partial [Gemmatales bacterium]|nr:hypothetical protein [Gemmatales bacterium]
MQRFKSWQQRTFVATLASMLGISLVVFSAWGQEGPAKTNGTTQTPAMEVQKTFTFEFRDTPW